MDPQVLLFLVLIVLVSGGIGVLADNLGRKMGKKRLVIGRLRPKHTARLGTFAAGVLTSTLTIVVVFAISAPVRTWIVEGTRITRKYQQLQGLNQSLQKAVDQRKLEVTALDKDLLKTNLNLKTVRGQLQLAQHQAKIAKQMLVLAQSKADAAVKRYQSAEAKVEHTGRQLVSLRLQFKQGQANLKKVKYNLTAISSQINDLSQQNLTLIHNIDQLKSQKTALEAQKDKLEQDTNDLQTQYKEKAAQLIAETEKVAEAKKAQAAAEVEVSKVQADLNKLKNDEAIYASVTSLTLFNPVIYGVGSEVVRVQVPAHLTALQAAAKVDNLIASASAEALSRGAARFKNSTLAADFANSDGSDTGVQKPDLVKQITGSRTDLVMIASSAVNAVQGAPVALLVKVVKNPLIYEQGKVLASQSFEPGKSISVIFDQLQKFLQEKVYRASLAKGMIPIAGREDSLLNVGPSQLIPVIDEISKAPLKVNVKVVATTDTRAADPLQIRFEVQ